MKYNILSFFFFYTLDRVRRQLEAGENYTKEEQTFLIEKLNQ